MALIDGQIPTAGQLANIAGKQLIENPNMVVFGESYDVRRSWRERLFTRPWKPWVIFKRLTPMVPMKKLLLAGDKIIGHPEAIKELIRGIDIINGAK